MDGSDVTVVDQTERHRFAVVDGADEAELTYQLHGDRFVLAHTGVPRAFRGRGVGGRLVEAAADRAARDGLTIVPQCPFVRRWLEEHPERAAELSVERPDAS